MGGSLHWVLVSAMLRIWKAPQADTSSLWAGWSNSGEALMPYPEASGGVIFYGDDIVAAAGSFLPAGIQDFLCLLPSLRICWRFLLPIRARSVLHKGPASGSGNVMLN